MADRTGIVLALAAIVAIPTVMFLTRRKDLTPNASGAYTMKPGHTYEVTLGIAPPVPEAAREAFRALITKDPLSGFNESGTEFAVRIQAPKQDLAGRDLDVFMFDPSGFNDIGGRVVRVVRVREFN